MGSRRLRREQRSFTESGCFVPHATNRAVASVAQSVAWWSTLVPAVIIIPMDIIVDALLECMAVNQPLSGSPS